MTGLLRVTALSICALVCAGGASAGPPPCTHGESSMVASFVNGHEVVVQAPSTTGCTL